MKKPEMKRVVSVKKVWVELQLIDFYANDEIAEKFSEFGEVEELSGVQRLHVDGRYDFADVRMYVDEYNEA